jgi:hypothetical protein
MSNLWNYLNSPELVHKVQNYFGIERIEKKSDDKADEKNYRVKNKFFYYLFIIGTELGKLIEFYRLFAILSIYLLRR